MKSVWQEADCPVGADWDLHEGAMVHSGQRVHCIWCGEEHDATIVQTYVIREDGQIEARPLPANAEELAALRREFEPPQQECRK